MVPTLTDSRFNQSQLCFKCHKYGPNADAAESNKGQSLLELCAPVDFYNPY